MENKMADYITDKKKYFAKNIRIARLNEVLNNIKHIKPKNVLEIGCGPGFNSFEFAKNTELLVAFDISQNIRIANKYKDQAKIGNIEFLLCDARYMPFRDNSFDLVYAGQVLEHIPNVEKAIEEIWRVSGKYSLVDVPTLLWEAYYYSFWIWVYILTNPKKILIKFINKAKHENANKGTVIKEMCVGDHINKLSTKKWIKLFTDHSIKVYDIKYNYYSFQLFIFGKKLIRNGK